MKSGVGCWLVAPEPLFTHKSRLHLGTGVTQSLKVFAECRFLCLIVQFRSSVSSLNLEGNNAGEKEDEDVYQNWDFKEFRE